MQSTFRTIKIILGCSALGIFLCLDLLLAQNAPDYDPYTRACQFTSIANFHNFHICSRPASVHTGATWANQVSESRADKLNPLPSIVFDFGFVNRENNKSPPTISRS